MVIKIKLSRVLYYFFLIKESPSDKGSKEKSSELLRKLQEAASQNKNIFEALMNSSKVCSLGKITNALFEVGGQYRRNM